MINKLIDRRAMLDRPRLLWSEVKLPDENLKVMERYAKRASYLASPDSPGNQIKRALDEKQEP